MIGGEIQIDPEFTSPERGQPIWALLDLPDGRSGLFGAAREAILWWVDHLKPPGPVLVPAYCCWSVIQPLRQAGVEVRYYPVGRDLAPDPAAVADLAGGAGSIHVIHYFGFPGPAGLFELNLPVLEDAVQALLSPELRRRGTWAIGSLRKFLPVPDGAFLVGDREFRVPRLPPAAGGPYGRKLFGRMLAHEAVRLGDADRWRDALAILAETEDELNRGPVRLHAMSPRTGEALRGAPLEGYARRRRSNYQTLYDVLRPVFADRSRGIRPLLGALPDGVVPYGLPILAERREALRDHLLARGICAFVHWDLPDDVDRRRFPDSWWIHDRELTLPVDHRYGPVEMATVAAAVAAFKP